MVAAFSLGLAALLVAPFASAQADDDGCTSGDPCPLIVDVDENGFYLINSVLYGQAGQPTHLDFTVGDWYQLTVDSMDPEASHTVSLSGHDAGVTVGPEAFADGNAFQFEAVGTYQLRDSPSGDEFEMRVVNGDTISSGSDSDSETDDQGAPGLAPAVLLAGLVALAVLRRR